MTDFVPSLPQFDESIYSLCRFDYNRLEELTRILVVTRAGEIKVLIKQSAENIIQIGLKLIEVKECLGHGQFGKWLAAEFEWSERSARQFMQVADAFKSANFAVLDFAPSALYLLANPSTPDSARSIALERAAQGESITHKVAKQIVSDVKGVGSKKRKPAQPEVKDPPEPSSKQLAPGPRTTSVPDNPLQGQPPMKDSSSCKWILDALQQRIMQILLYDAAVGMKIERLAREYGKLPSTIVTWGIEAFEVLPEREKKITELVVKSRENAEIVLVLQSRLTELQQALTQKDSRLEELELAIAQKDSRLEELELAIAHKDSRLEELEQTIAHKDSRLTELEQTIAHKDSRLTELEQAIVQKETNLEELEQTIYRRDTNLAELEEVIARKDDGIATLNELLSAAESSIATLEDEKIELEEKLAEEYSESGLVIANLEEILKERHQRIFSLEKKLDECRQQEQQWVASECSLADWKWNPTPTRAKHY